MSTISSAVKVSDVTRVFRPGIGPVYRAVVQIGDLYHLLSNAVIRYAPRYQRGFNNKSLISAKESDYDRLLPLNDMTLQISTDRAQEMAVKYLKANSGDPNIVLFSSNIVWNARQEDGRPTPFFDEKNRELSIYTAITIPDTAHRHTAYYFIGLWKQHPDQIPPLVKVNAVEVSKKEIEDMLKNVDLEDAEHHSIYVDIYNLDKVKEGWLYDEFNSDAKPPSRAVGLDLNQQKTPSRRFMWALVEKCPIFGRDEVETRSSTIAAQSRKITTTSTLESAIQPMVKQLLALEQEGSGRYDDLVAFFCAYYHEWARHYTAFMPKASLADRQKLRESSLAGANILFFPMFTIAYELWKDCQDRKVDWKSDKGWKSALAKMAGTVTTNFTDDQGNKQIWTGNAMDRLNPDWQGKILIQTFDGAGKPKGWSLSSTRQTREAAYAYLKGLMKP